MSLDKVAQLTGISKSMLGQIERGESNPTINTLWKVANELKVSFTSLIKDHQPDTLVIKRDEIEPLIEDDGKYRLYPFSRSKKTGDSRCTWLRLNLEET